MSNNIIEKTIINRFDRTEENKNSVIDNETLQEYSVDSILTDEENRTLWINGMPFGNVYIHFARESVSGTQPTHAEIFNDFDNNIALGDYSHVEGYKNKTEATYSHVEGQKNIINSDPKDNAQAAHAEGRENTINNAPNSHVEGKGNKIETDGREAHVEGYGNTATAQAAHAEGMGTIAMGKGSHAEGINTTAEGQGSHAEGGYTYVDTETQETVFVNGGKAEGVASHAEGADTQAIGNVSHAEGYGTKTTNNCSHAEGWKTEAKGQSAHAEGNESKAVANNSHAEGQNTLAGGQGSHAEGIGTIANNEAEHASGKYNVSNTGTIFSVGIGTSDKAEDRKNAVDIIKKQSGNDYITTVNTDLNITENKIVTIGDPQEYSGDNINIDNTKLRVAGGIYIDGDLVTTGTHYIVDVETDLAKELHVEGITQIDGDTTIGTTDVPADLTVNGDTILNHELTVFKATDLKDKLIVDGDAILKGNTEIGTNSDNTLKVNSNTDLVGNLTVGGDTELESTEISTLTVEGETTLSTTYVGNNLINPQDKGVLQVGGNVTIETTNGEYGNISLKVNNTTELDQLTVNPTKGNHVALQVDTNGDIYIGPDQDGNNPCNYAGIEGETSVTLQSLIVNQYLEEVTYNELYRRRNSSELKPGKFYRIVDYITTTTQENTVSAGYQFDIIVLALSKNTLSEDAWAVQHDFSKNENNVDITLLQKGFKINAYTMYFNDCNITLPNNLFTFYLRGNENSDNQLDIILSKINGDTVLNPKNLQNVDISFNGSTILENVNLFTHNMVSTSRLLFVDYTKQSVINYGETDINIDGMYIVGNTPLCSFTLNNSKYLFLAYTGVENGDIGETYVVFIPIYVGNVTPTNDQIQFTGAIVFSTSLNSNDDDNACLSFLQTCFNTDYREISITFKDTLNAKLTEDISLSESAVKDTKIQITLNDYDMQQNNQSSLWCEVYDEELGKNDIKISSYSNLKGKLEYHFENSNLNGWKLRYCLDNDYNKFQWVAPIRNIGDYIFGRKNELYKYSNANNLTEILFNKYEIAHHEFNNYNKLEFVYISDNTNVETVNHNSSAFAGCDALKTICVKSSEIYMSEFASCDKLQNIYLENTGTLKLHEYAFANSGIANDQINIFIHAHNINFYSNTGEFTTPDDITLFLFGNSNGYKNTLINIYCNKDGFQSLKTYNKENVSVTEDVVVDSCPLSDYQKTIIDDINNSNYSEIYIKINSEIENTLNIYKGVIYRMIDEFGNDCPYDFKNIMLANTLDSEESEYNYIFYGNSFSESEDNPYPKNNEDWSITGEIKNNHIFCNTAEIPSISFFSYISNSTGFGGERKLVCKNNTIINSNNIIVNRCQNNYIINKNYTNITDITGNTQFIFGGNILADNVYQSNQ